MDGDAQVEPAKGAIKGRRRVTTNDEKGDVKRPIKKKNAKGAVLSLERKRDHGKMVWLQEKARYDKKKMGKAGWVQ